MHIDIIQSVMISVPFMFNMNICFSLDVITKVTPSDLFEHFEVRVPASVMPEHVSEFNNHLSNIHWSAGKKCVLFNNL